MTRIALIVLALVVALATADAQAASTWYVRAGSDAGGAGSKRHPFTDLATVQAAGRRGDRIVVLPAPAALDGGIRLKRGQRLVGAGRAALTNTDPGRLHGDAVRLASGTTVRGLLIEGAARGAVYGHDVTDVTVLDTIVHRHNTSCAEGFLIPPFAVPTLISGVGIPISEGLKNGWAAIMVDVDRGASRVHIARNRVTDADCGDGIDIRASGTADVRARIERNAVRRLREGPDLASILAIGLQSRDTAHLVAHVDRNRQSGLGNDEDFGTGPSGADSEGVFVNPTGASRLRATITRNTYRHTAGRGGFSANGLEYVSMGDGSRSLLDVSDSSFSGTPGDVLEQLALGTNARMHLRLDRVTATASTGFSGSGFGDTVVIPGNNADCLIGASGGAGNRVILDVHRSTLTDCANNGLTFGSSVANGQGETALLQLTVADSVITGNRGGNLRVANISALSRLLVKVERTDLGDSHGSTSTPANVTAQDLATTADATIDLGGGALGSAGGNCLDGGTLSAALIGYDVSARNAWWGDAAGPGLGRTVAVGGTLDAGAPLAAKPSSC